MHLVFVFAETGKLVLGVGNGNDTGTEVAVNSVCLWRRKVHLPKGAGDMVSERKALEAVVSSLGASNKMACVFNPPN